MIKEYEFEGKTIEEAINAGVEKLGIERENANYDIVSTPKSGFLGFGSKPAVVKFSVEQPDEVVADKPEEVKKEIKKEIKNEVKTEKKPSSVSENSVAAAVDFLKNTLEKMSVSVEDLETRTEGNEILINIKSSEKGFIIGRRGENLDALQYLTTLAVNRGSSEHVKIALDIGGYRDERVKTLENLALRLAAKAKKTRRNVSLEPMNAYERKVIHSALQNDKTITTYSVGEEPNRKIVISCKPKKDA